MSITGLFIVLLIACLFILNFSKQSGGSPSGWSAVTIPQTSNIYSQQFNELDNVNNVLNRPVVPGNEYINNLQPHDTKEHANLGVLPKESVPDIASNPVPEGTKVILESKQPYFLDSALIVNYYGKTHYWDERYPRQPLPIEFAMNPDKFVKEHPSEYPSYVIESRNLSNLEPYDPDYE